MALVFAEIRIVAIGFLSSAARLGQKSHTKAPFSGPENSPGHGCVKWYKGSKQLNPESIQQASPRELI